MAAPRPGPATGDVLGRVALSSVSLAGGPPVDVLVSGDTIVSVSAGLAQPGWRAIDGRGLVLLPALVDLHTHLREPGDADAETIASGTRAAAAGGYGTVFAMANTSPVTDTPQRVRRTREIAGREASCDVQVVGAVTVGLRGRRLAPLAEMAAEGVTMFSDDGHCVDDPGIMNQALRYVARHGGVIAQHAQAGGIARHGQVNEGAAADRTHLPPWPASAEESIVARDAALAGRAGAPLHICHVSTAGTVNVIRWAKANGWPVTAEVTPHHLLLDDTATGGRDPRFKVNPPLRGADDVAALRAAVRDGTIDVIATDHAPHSDRSKRQEWTSAPFGMTGLETALPVVAQVLAANEEPDWKMIARTMAHRPAEVGGIAATAGRPLRPGEPASFCLVAPGADWRVEPGDFRSRSANSPYIGMTLKGRVVATVLRGTVTHDAQQLFGRRQRPPGGIT